MKIYLRTIDAKDHDNKDNLGCIVGETSEDYPDTFQFDYKTRHPS